MVKREIFIAMIKIIIIIIKIKIKIKIEIKIKTIITIMRMRMTMTMTIINKIFFSEQNIKMSYYLFNRQEILEKAKKDIQKKKLLNIIYKIKKS